MFSLIDSKDSKVMANSRFVKNAVFYKDLFAFFDAYEKLMAEDKANLPNYCVIKKGEYSLEGICLFMRLYSSELGFESVRLTLDYLKVLYFTIAGYSEDGETVKKSEIENEYKQYKDASIDIVSKTQKEIFEAEKVHSEKKKKLEKMNAKQKANLVASKVLHVLTIVVLVAGVFSTLVPMSFWQLGTLSLKSAIIASSVIFVSSSVLFAVLKISSKKTSEKESDLAYVLQGVKKEKEVAFEKLKEIKNKTNRIISEKYEYLHSFSDDLAKFSNKLTFDKVLERANEYKLMSYNVAHDVKRLFLSQDKDISNIVQQIASLPVANSSAKELTLIYQQIKESDWFYFNNEIRFNFLKKFTDIAEKTHDWFMTVENQKISPFEIEIKDIAKQEVAFLNSTDELFVASSIDKFLNTKYVKNLNAFELKGNANADVLKTIKVDYISHFFNFETVKEFNNLFYDKKIIDGVKVTDEILLENEKIPTYAYLKIKLLENNIGLGNSESFAVKQIANEINGVFGIEEVEKQELVVFDESDITYPTCECDEVIESDGTVEFVYGNTSVVGYKLSNV